MINRLLHTIIFTCILFSTMAQDASLPWHGKEKVLKYHPQGTDFIIENGNKRFNRALYGGNTAFRAEAGDLPEFAMYMPGMGGNIRFALMTGSKSKWLITAKYIKAIYRPGSMLYEIRDELLGDGRLRIHVIALYDREGLLVKMEGEHIPGDIQLLTVFGGATGKKFSRDGDIGADPESSFYLQPDYCKDNIYRITRNSFLLKYGFSRALSEEERYEVQHLVSQKPDTSGTKILFKQLTGVFPVAMDLKLADASQLQNARDLFLSAPAKSPVVTGKISLQSNTPLYFLLQNPKADKVADYNTLPDIFNNAEQSRSQLAERIKVTTPDPYINTIGGSLSIAADAVWEDPSFMHGAIAWRMRLNGWRGAYVADVLGWHDRAKKHFSSYALSQLTTPLTGPVVADTALHLGRQLEKLGTSLFSSGYISRNPNGDFRPHHYDMNLVFIDQLLNHFNWSGDTAYVKQMWPLLQRHLAWEKRNFDVDGDGLYDSYAAIWASDALQYSGGGVTHSSAYNYRANKTAAALAVLIGEDPAPYEKEAAKILAAINKKLWLPKEGWYAEYKDLLGKQLVHPAAALWTIYHALDSKVPDAFRAYRSLRYIDLHIPHIPVLAKGLDENDLYLLSTSNWQPYTWSLNNVVMAENLHTALAYWQGGRTEEAFHLWRSTIIETMYLSSSPGNFEQLSFYDAIRGELYRDFADGIGMAGRSLVEGLFGIQPDALHDTLAIEPGFPASWRYARLETPDIKFDFSRSGLVDQYFITQSFPKTLDVKLIVPAFRDGVTAVTMNGKKLNWKAAGRLVGKPVIEINLPVQHEYAIIIEWKGKEISRLVYDSVVLPKQKITITGKGVTMQGSYDPQQAFTSIQKSANTFLGTVGAATGDKTVFIKVKQGAFTWWEPVDLLVKQKETVAIKKSNNNSSRYEKIDLTTYFNDQVGNIFKNEYLSPRPAVPTLQLPAQGIGNWAYPLTNVVIDDTGLRARAGEKNEIVTSEGIPFATPSVAGQKNIVFTSQWDNYPDSARINLSGKASHAWFLMAGSTNPMQSRFVNGEVVIAYKDGSVSALKLENPGTWWPIEQDYYEDGFAFTTDAPKPLRVYLKSGIDTRAFNDFTTIKGFSNRGIDGGAATVLDLALDPKKELKSIMVKTIANDVVIGLMSITLTR